MEEVLIVLCVVMPSLKFVVFLLLEKRKTTDRDQLNLERYLFQNKRLHVVAVHWAHILRATNVTVNTQLHKYYLLRLTYP